MPTYQLERLKKDVEELEAYITKLKRNGNQDRVKILEVKKEYITNHVMELS